MTVDNTQKSPWTHVHVTYVTYYIRGYGYRYMICRYEDTKFLKNLGYKDTYVTWIRPKSHVSVPDMWKDTSHQVFFFATKKAVIDKTTREWYSVTEHYFYKPLSRVYKTDENFSFFFLFLTISIHLDLTSHSVNLSFFFSRFQFLTNFIPISSASKKDKNHPRADEWCLISKLFCEPCW